jgi:hypothetical protein
MDETIEYILCDENKCIELVERIIEEHSIVFLNKCIDDYQRKKANKIYEILETKYFRNLDKFSLEHIKYKLDDYINDTY